MTTLLTGGTVRSRFDEEAQRKTQERQRLGAALRELKVPDHYLGMVERLLELCPGADEIHRRATRIVMTALLSGVERGSTGLPLERDANDIGLLPEVNLLLETARRLDEEGAVFRDDRAQDFVDTFHAFRREESAKPLIGTGRDYRPLIVDSGVLYTHKMAAMERRVANTLAGLLASPDVVATGQKRTRRVVKDVLGQMPFEMEEKERAEKLEALRIALPGRFAVISGGAGSGKTTIVLTILRVLHRLDSTAGGISVSDMALAAPTGKAAKRLDESITDQLDNLNTPYVDEFRQRLSEPKTLHRLLEYSPYFNEFRRNADRHLDAKLVVVDEASMVGLGMMQALVEALPDDGRLLLVGDAGQLPSVEAGAVFHDLSDVDAAPEQLAKRICILRGNYRVGDEEGADMIIEAAEEIRSGAATVEELERQGVMQRDKQVSADAGVRFFPVAELDTGEKVIGDVSTAEFLKRWWDLHYSAVLTPEGEQTALYRSQTTFDHDEQGRFSGKAEQALETLFETTASTQVLCITRVGKRGSNALNRRMHNHYLRANVARRADADRFQPGEPVIITKNDYDQRVFNGDQGLVLYTRTPEEQNETSKRAKKRIVIVDGQGFRAVSFQKLKDRIEHAYALTVHKAQGSEYDHVAVVLPKLLEMPVRACEMGAGESSELAKRAVHPLMTRQILYTGLTRSITSVTVVGEAEVFDRGVLNSAGRYSGVGRRLKDSTKPAEQGAADRLEAMNDKTTRR